MNLHETKKELQELQQQRDEIDDQIEVLEAIIRRWEQEDKI